MLHALPPRRRCIPGVGSKPRQADAEFTAWRTAFEKAPHCQVAVTARQIRLDAAGQDGPLEIIARAPWDASAKVQIVPQPYQGVLEVDGNELGRPLLTAVAPLCSFPPNTGPLACIAVPTGKPVYWEAESGLIFCLAWKLLTTQSASGRRCVGQAHSDLGEPSGLALWTLSVEKPGRYWLWARVRSGDAAHGKFELRVTGEDGGVARPFDWLLRSPDTWQWKPLQVGGKAALVPLDLPKGICRISLQTRQSGTLIDRLMLTDDEQWRPSEFE